MYHCDKCNYTAAHKQNYNSHLLSKKHMEEKIESYECKKCNYTTIYKHCYDRHLLSKKHMEEKKVYECKFCKFHCETLTKYNRHNETKKHLQMKQWYPMFKKIEKRWISYHENKRDGKEVEEPCTTTQKILKKYNNMDWDISPL